MTVMMTARKTGCGLLWLVSFLFFAGAGAGLAEDDPCAVPEELTLVNYPADRVYARIKEQATIKILVVGSSSSQGSPAWASKGLPSAFKAYPQLLEKEIAARLPGGRVAVIDKTAASQTAPMEAAQLDRLLSQFRPDLVIWETGTTDAVHRIDVREFGDAVAEGLQRLRQRGVDVVLVDSQFSPQTEPLYDFQPYLDYLWQLGEANDANILRRYEVMRYYVDAGRFDPGASDPQAQVNNANFVHRCLARQLATMILTSAQQQPKE